MHGWGLLWMLLPSIATLASGQAARPQRKNLMAELAVEVHVLRTPVVTGESLFVSASLVNRGSQPVEVPSDSGPSPFHYRLHALSTDLPDFEMSWQLQAEARIAGTPTRPLPLPHRMLPPKYRTGRTEDLTDLASQPFPPGKYEVRASIFAGGAVLESAPVAIEIVAPLPVGLVTALSRESRQRISAFAQNTGGEWVILQQQASLRRPDWSVWQRYTLKPGPAGPVTLAVTVDEARYIGDRWLGWMEGSLVHAARLLPQRDVMPDPVQLAVESRMTNARLLSPGFQRPDGSVLFFAFGDGRLAAFRFGDAGASKLWEVASAADLSGAAISLAPGASMTAVYTEGGSLRYQRWSLDGKPVAEPADLFSLTEALVSLRLEEVAAEPELEIVMGPSPSPDPKYSVVRSALNGAPKQSVSFIPGFSVPPDSLKVAAWGERIELVAGSMHGYARFSLPEDKLWRPRHPGMEMVSLDRDNNGRSWLHAFEPRFGFRWIALDGAPAH
jgi:hypothetical protein